MRHRKIYDCTVNDKNTCNKNEGPFNSCGNKFHLPVAIRMISIFWLCRNIQAVNSDQSGHHVHNAFQCISKNGNRVCDIPGGNLYHKKDNRKSRNLFLNFEVLYSFVQGNKLATKIEKANRNRETLILPTVQNHQNANHT